MILLNPGPVTLSDRVRNALLKPDLCHREVEFTDLQTTIRNQLLNVYDLDRDRWAAVLLTGSGTAAVEAMLTSLVPAEGKLLVIENGVYGERLSRIAEIHRIPCISLPHDWGAEVDSARLQTCLNEHSDITHLAVVHHETTTGRLNQLSSIASLCRDRGVQLLVDGVSSFGAEALAFDAWGISACAATANKCLHGVPGAAFVIVQRHALANANLKRSLYLDLATYCQAQDQGGTPFTQSVQTFYALAEALAELVDQGGWMQRQQHYRELATLVRRGLMALGIQPLLSEQDSSVVLNAYYLPPGVSYGEFHDRLKAGGFIIYAGQGALARSIFRVSTMGSITARDMENFLAIVRDLVKSVS